MKGKGQRLEKLRGQHLPPLRRQFEELLEKVLGVRHRLHLSRWLMEDQSSAILSGPAASVKPAPAAPPSDHCPDPLPHPDLGGGAPRCGFTTSKGKDPPPALFLPGLRPTAILLVRA